MLGTPLPSPSCGFRPALRGVMSRPMTPHVHYKLMRLLEAKPEMSQRNMARSLGVSLGKVNYSLKALISNGWISVRHVRNSSNNAGCMYLLTPRGKEQKYRLATRVLRSKMCEFEALRLEIDELRRETEASGL